jgi:beta-galactosidase
MTPDLHLVDQLGPGLLRSLAGVEVEDWTTLAPGETRTAAFEDGSTVAMYTFVERLRLRGAKALATWTGNDTLLGDACAIAIKQTGRGRVMYVGGFLPADGVGDLVARLLKQVGIRPLIRASERVEVVERRARGKRFLALLNYGRSPETVTGLPGGKDLLTGAKVNDGQLILPPLGVAVVETR